MSAARMQPGTEDIGPEDLTGISAVSWHESFRSYDASVEGKPAKPTQQQREAMARVRTAILSRGYVRTGEALFQRPCRVQAGDLDVFAAEVMGVVQ